MGVLADEYIRLRPDVSRMPREIKRAGHDAGRTFGTSFGSAAKKLLAAGALFAGVSAVARFLGEANEEARESIKVGKTTAQIIKSTGGAAKVTSKQVGDLAGAISLKTGMDDEAIQSGANLLLTFKNVRNEVGTGAKIFDRATLAAVDLSAAGFGSVSSTSKILGKALNDPLKGLTALSRAGVTFTDGQKKQIKKMIEAGDTLGAQKIIMKEVESQVGNVAEAQADWADKAKVAFDDVKETAGGFLRQGLEPVSKWFVETGLPAVQDFFKKISSDKDLKVALTSLKDSLVALTGKDFKASLDGLAVSLPPVVTAISNAITKYKEFSDFIDTFENKSFAEGDKRGGPVGQIVKDFKAGGTIEVALVHARGIIGPALDSIFGTGGVVEDAMVKARTAVTSTFGAGGTIEQAVIQFRGSIVRHVKKAWADVKAAFIADARAVVTTVGQFVGRVVGWFARLPGRVMVWVRKLWTDAKVLFIKNHSELLAGVSRFLARMIAFFVGWFTNLRTRWSTFWTGIKKVGSDAINSVRTTIDRVLGQIRTGFSRGVSAIGTAWNRIKAVARTPVAFVVNTILNDGLLNAVRKISTFVNYGPGKDIKVSMARGGVLPGYTPGRDVHRFYSATGGMINLSGGEGILRPELTRAIGERRLNTANRKARNGRAEEGVHDLGGFATGGIAGAIQLGRAMGISRITTYPGHHPSQALARDFMTSSPSKHEQLSSGLWANRRLFRLWYIISRRRIISMTRPGAGWRPYTRSNPHTDHVHASFYPGALAGIVGALTKGGGILGGLASTLNPAKYLGMVTSALGRLKEISGSPFGQMVSGIPRTLAGAVRDKITSLASTFLGSVGSGVSGAFTSVTGGSNRAIGKRMMLQRWPASQWPALNSLWTKESGWRTTARNPSSGAYGIPQSLPASKMASAGADWRTNPATQIKWGLGYIASRYGSPLSAWRHSQRTNWYGMGGVINEPVMGLGMRTGQSYGFGEHGPETVTPGRGGGRPINIHVHYDQGIVQVIQGVIDDNDQFKQTVGRAR